MLFLENVPGLLNVNGGKAFREILDTLAASGWIAEWDCFPAGAVGAPHLRDRIFLLAADPNRVDLRILTERHEQRPPQWRHAESVHDGSEGDEVPDAGGERQQTHARTDDEAADQMRGNTDARERTNGGSLPEAARQRMMLPSPLASDSKRASNVTAERNGTKGGGKRLATEASRVMPPTPTATDCKASGTAGNWTKESGRNAGTTLTDATCRQSGQASSDGLRLNPRFVEWMMGLPMDWTSLGVTWYSAGFYRMPIVRYLWLKLSRRFNRAKYERGPVDPMPTARTVRR